MTSSAAPDDVGIRTSWKRTWSSRAAALSEDGCEAVLASRARWVTVIFRSSRSSCNATPCPRAGPGSACRGGDVARGTHVGDRGLPGRVTRRPLTTMRLEPLIEIPESSVTAFYEPMGVSASGRRAAAAPRGPRAPDRAAADVDALERGLEPGRVLGELVGAYWRCVRPHAMRPVGARRGHAQQQRAPTSTRRLRSSRITSGAQHGARRSPCARRARAVARRSAGCALRRRRPRRGRRADGRPRGSARAQPGRSPSRCSPRNSSSISSRTIVLAVQQRTAAAPVEARIEPSKGVLSQRWRLPAAAARGAA